MVDRPHRTNTQRREVKLENFYRLAWEQVRDHYNAEQQTNPDASAQKRDEATKVQLTLSDGTIINGSTGSERIHAESKAYDNLWENALDAGRRFFGTEQEIRTYALNYVRMTLNNAQVKCVDVKTNQDCHKPSCFMCSAIAHSLGVRVESKDLTGYTEYNLPRLFREAPDIFLQELVGTEAFKIYQTLDEEERGRIFTSLGSVLYEMHRYNRQGRDTGEFVV